jgi:two-component system sensor histidine kinase/response regulator
MSDESRSQEARSEETAKAGRPGSTAVDQAAGAVQPPASKSGRGQKTPDKQNRILLAILRSMSAGVVVAHKSGKFLLFNPEAERIFGIGAIDAPASEWAQRYGFYLPDRTAPFPAEQLPLVRALRGDEIEETEMFVRNAQRPEGVWVRVKAGPLRDGTGSVRGGLAVIRDVTKQKEAERRLAAQYAVTRVLAEATSLREAAPKILQALCESVDWHAGTLWFVDRRANVLRCVDVWLQDKSKTAAFAAATRSMTCAPGVGLPGRVWAERASAWVVDLVHEVNFPRGQIASQCNLQAAFAFPILAGQEVTGVIESFSQEVRKPDRDLLSMIDALGSQIGQFIKRRRTEEELRVSRERFEVAMQGSRDGVWDWDLRTNQVYFNPRWKSMLGCEDHEINNRFEEWEKRIHPDDRERSLAVVRAYLDGLAPVYELEHRLQHKDGSYRWILARGVALRDADGKPYRMAGSHTDITERKQAEQALRDSEALYHSLVETLPLNVFRKDLHGRFTFGNQLFCQSLGKPPEEFIGKTDFDFYPAELAEKYRQDDRRVIKEKVILNEVEEHHKPNGEKIYVQVLKTPVYDSREQVIGTQAIFWDVSDRRRAMEEMRKAKEAAESANRAKSAFLANMSHEIRTPMNAIIGMTELVLETDLTGEQREYLELVKKSADSLLAVINDILDFSKVEAGRLELDSIAFSLRDHLGDMLNTLAPRAYQKGLELACHVAPHVPDHLRGDPVRLGQVLVNLVGNALKFTKQGEVVVDVGLVDGGVANGEGSSWSVRESMHRTAHLHFTVRDTGIGVPEDKREIIFDPFTQADGSTTRQYGGTGLGLAIARRLVEMMGGRIWVESEAGKGSAFHFTAQLEVQDTPATRPIPIEAASIQGMSVLVVDDNATNRRILEEILSHWQMKPALADNASQALELLLQAARSGEPIPLALLDVQMPGTDGYMLAERIRQQPEIAGTTLLVLTSSAQSGENARRQELGINSYLSKPIKQADLWKAIMQALGMPLASEARVEPSGEQPQPQARQLRVLLAEDNLVNQKLAVRLLERRGHQVTVANNGREALDLLKQQAFDVVLMDVQMPEMDGYAATMQIRQEEQRTGAHIPILAMTAYAMKGDRERCLAVGMDGYISKPVRAKELFESIEGIQPTTKHAGAQPPEHSRAEGIFDEAEALRRLGEDRPLLRELVEVFLDECPRLLDTIRNAIAKKDAVRLRIAAHGLKGAIDNFVAPAAYEAALRLEMIGRDGNLAEAEQACSRLEKEIDRLVPALGELYQRAQIG